MEKKCCSVHRDLVLCVNIHFNDGLMKEIYDVVSFEVSLFSYPFYNFILISGDSYRVPLSDIYSISISPIYDSDLILDPSDPLYRYAKHDQSLNLLSEEEPF